MATTNQHKVREIRALLDGAGVELRTLAEWPAIEAPEETGHTFEENARLKALYYGRATGELVVAEDSGLEVDALGGEPGVESARYGGVEADYPRKFALIYKQLAARPDTPRAARFVCALALVRGAHVLFETRGTVEGEIASAPRGDGGFGYDPIFFYPPFGQTLGQLSGVQKAAISHRGQAFRKLRGFFLSNAP